jgi:hypothetical protein
MADYDPTICRKNLSDKHLQPACDGLINPYHCDDVTGLDPVYHQFCADSNIYYQPIQVTVCYNASSNAYKYFPSASFFQDCAKQGAGWNPAFCYCCCSCFANDTLIAVPEGLVPIFTIPVGASVLTASVMGGGGGLQVEWKTATVKFSQGTGQDGHQPMMVYIVYGEDESRDILCSSGQPFLLADGTYTTAGKLRPGQQLVNYDGKPVTAKLVSIGAYEGGVHHISTNMPWTGNPNGHLLLAGGVVAGDFEFQMNFDKLSSSLKEDDHDTLPLLGTQEYEDTHGANVQRGQALFEFVQPGTQGPQVGQRQLASGVFKTYRAKGKAEMPYGAASLLTQKQAESITGANQVPLSNPIPKSLFETCRKQLAGFYPDITFYYDTLDVTPNLYAFEAYGRKIVLVSGGLARIVGFNHEGLFMAMAHGAGCFYGGAPQVSSGFSAVGQADLYAFGVVSRLCWTSTPFLTYVMAAMDQWKGFFAMVTAGAEGNPLDPLNDPSLACRFQTIQAAAAGGALPECAGGEPLLKIELEQATAATLDHVQLIFNLALNPEGANDPSNYTFNPSATVTKVQVAANNFTVELDVKLDAGQSYEVTAQNLTSILGTGIDPAHASASFESPKS